MASNEQPNARSQKRPLSPFMIGPYYKPQLTSVLSITHRLTGVALAVGTLVLVYWLAAIAAGPEAYAHAQHVLSNPFMGLLLFLWTWAFFYHFCNGIRHLFWDAGYGFEITTVYKSGKLVVAASIVLTFLVWLLVA